MLVYERPFPVVIIKFAAKVLLGGKMHVCFAGGFFKLTGFPTETMNVLLEQ